jgi:hypothetical protein
MDYQPWILLSCGDYSPLWALLPAPIDSGDLFLKIFLQFASGPKCVKDLKVLFIFHVRQKALGRLAHTPVPR